MYTKVGAGTASGAVVGAQLALTGSEIIWLTLLALALLIGGLLLLRAGMVRRTY